MATPNIKFNKPAKDLTPKDTFADLLGGSQKQGDIVEIPIDKLIPYHDNEGNPQPFDMYPLEKLEGLAERIGTMGVLNPIIVRPHKTEAGSYEIIAGHNRTKASGMAGKTTIPAIIMELDDDAARLVMIETNLDQREQLTIKEKAYAYKQKLDLENHQGHRTDLHSRQFVVRFTQAEKRKAQRYAKLTELTPELLDMASEKIISVEAGYNLAFLSKHSQNVLNDFICANKVKSITTEQSTEIRNAETNSGLSEAEISNIFFPVKESNAKAKVIKIKPVVIKEYIPENVEDSEEFIINALSYYKENHPEEYQ